MKKTNERPKIETTFYIMPFVATIIGAAIQFFLSGYFLSIPFCPKEGFIGVGVNIVLKIIISAIIIYGLLLLISYIRQVNIKQQPEFKKPIYYMTVSTAISTTLIQSFLNGEIIDIPYGTHEGRVVGAIGVGVILIVMFVVSFFTMRFINRIKK